MPTGHGLLLGLAGVFTIAIGRIFALTELYIIGTAMISVVVVSVGCVLLTLPRITVRRQVSPEVLTVGETGRVDISLKNVGRLPTTALDLTDPNSTGRRNRATITSIRAAQRRATAYRLPALDRGLLTLGPIVMRHEDPLGLAVGRSSAGAYAEVSIAPAVVDLACATVGRGPLGRRLATAALHAGQGEFKGLRPYVPGDDLRSVHWKSSARTASGLLVKQTQAPQLDRCSVVLDTDDYDDPAQFEIGASIAASLVTTFAAHGVATRFVGGDVTLDGPRVAGDALMALARLDPGTPMVAPPRDSADGLGVLVVITSGSWTDAWALTERSSDPATVRLGVSLDGDPSRDFIDGSAVDVFAEAWANTVGVPYTGAPHA